MIELQNWEIAFIVQVQSGFGSLTSLLEALSFLGRFEFFIFILMVMFWCVSESDGIRLAIVLVTANSLGMILKLGFHMPRPYWISSQVAGLAAESSYGMPSQHALSATAMWPWLGKQAAGTVGLILGLLIVLGISFSRVSLGVHFPTDVFAGWLLGGALIGSLWWGERNFRPVLQRSSMFTQCMMVCIASLSILISQAICLWAINPIMDSPEWARLAGRVASIAPRDPSNNIRTAGILIGVGLGIACQRKWARFQTGGLWWKQALRLFVGGMGLVFLFRGLGYLVPAGNDTIGFAWMYLQAALTAYWIMFLAPWVFLKLKLAERATVV